MARRLLIDDHRGWREVLRIVPAPTDVQVIARTFGEGLAMLQQHRWDELYLDHDLGDDATGHDVMLWLERRPEILPHRIILVTANPIGHIKMAWVIDRLRRQGRLS
jgi:hypothetical protein